MVVVSGPEVSPGLALSGFRRVRSAGSVLLSWAWGPEAETHLKPRCYLQLERNSVSAVHRPEALSLKQFPTDQNLMS